MTDNYNVILLTNPGADRKLTKELYQQSVAKLARAFNRAHPEYSEQELYEKAWDALITRHFLVSKTISWFRRFFFGWKDAVRLDFGVHESLAGGHVWYCKLTNGRIQKGVFVPQGHSYKKVLENEKMIRGIK